MKTDTSSPGLSLRVLVSIHLIAALVFSAPLLAQETAPEEAGPGGEVEQAPAVEPLGGAPVDEGVVDAAGEELARGETELGEDTEAGALDYSLLELIQFGGIIGYAIVFLSLVGVALIIDNVLLLRRKVLIPPDEVNEIRVAIEEGAYDRVVTDPPRSSFVGVVTAAGVSERDRGYEAVVKAMEDSADELTGRLLRRIEILNILANVAPMLGLLGTVVGMVKSFNTISVAAGGADPRLLAAGIFQALMTTVMGLTVAIPTVFVYGLLRNRVDSLAADASATAEQLVSPLRETSPDTPRARHLARV